MEQEKKYNADNIDGVTFFLGDSVMFSNGASELYKCTIENGDVKISWKHLDSEGKVLYSISQVVEYFNDGTWIVTT